MNGGGKKKKSKRAPAAAEAAGQGGGGGSERKKPGEEGVSVRAACAHQLLLVTRAAQVARSAPKPPLPSPPARSRWKRPTGCEPRWAWHRFDSRAIGSPQALHISLWGNGGPWHPGSLPEPVPPTLGLSWARYPSLSFCHCRLVVCTVLRSAWYIRSIHKPPAIAI